MVGELAALKVYWMVDSTVFWSVEKWAVSKVVESAGYVAAHWADLTVVEMEC